MVVANNKIDETKKSGKSTTILMAMVMQRTRRGTSPNEAYPGLHLKPLDAAIGQVPAPYRPGGHHGRRFRKNTQNTNKTQLLASNYGTFRASCL
jgi:hypothetical protein